MVDVYLFLISFIFTVSNNSLAPTFDIGGEFMEQKIKELVLQYNYTLNPKGVYEAIKFMYTYWPDAHCRTCIRNEYINVSFHSTKRHMSVLIAMT